MKLFYYSKSKTHNRSDTDNLIKKSIEKYCGETSPQYFPILRTSEGKPYIEGNPLYIGVSHTDDIVVIGVSDSAFGIDCENISRKTARSFEIAKKYFSQKEFEYIYPSGYKIGNTDEDLRFLEIWVKKEAYVKYLGTGLADISKYDILSVDGEFEKVNHVDNLIYIYKPTKMGKKD